MRVFNNKGFAVSTILYGILSLVIIILMLIFGIMKSSKDMSQDLVEGIEEELNQCVNSEIILENCYFSGGECDPKVYNSCIGKKEEYVTLANVVSVGDYVNYDAGGWTSTVAIPTSGSSYRFGGYQAGKTRNSSVTCNNEDIDQVISGWRVLSVNNDTITLIHAGISECFIFDNQEKAVYVLTGNHSNSISTDGLTVKDWSIYVNKEYAVSASILTKELIDNFYGHVLTDTELLDNDLLKYSETYLLGDTLGGNIRYVASNKLGYGISANIAYGIKPIVILKENVKTSGFLTNTYGEKEWILINEM